MLKIGVPLGVEIIMNPQVIINSEFGCQKVAINMIIIQIWVAKKLPRGTFQQPPMLKIGVPPGVQIIIYPQVLLIPIVVAHQGCPWCTPELLLVRTSNPSSVH